MGDLVSTLNQNNVSCAMSCTKLVERVMALSFPLAGVEKLFVFLVENGLLLVLVSELGEDRK